MVLLSERLYFGLVPPANTQSTPGRCRFTFSPRNPPYTSTPLLVNTGHPCANIPYPSNPKPPHSVYTATHHRRTSSLPLSLKSSRLLSTKSLLLLGASRPPSAVWIASGPSFLSSHSGVYLSLVALIEMTFNLENSCSALLIFFVLEGENDGVSDVMEREEGAFDFACV